MSLFGHPNERSEKRRQRAERKATGSRESNGTPDRNCIRQEITDVGVWPSGQPMQRIRYLHVTKGWRDRLLPPAFVKRLV